MRERGRPLSSQLVSYEQYRKYGRLRDCRDWWVVGAPRERERDNGTAADGRSEAEVQVWTGEQTSTADRGPGECGE
jgi:hypothetical protein